ncbi:MAG TPA: hypothetical protein VKD90_17765, partial [Gemmataceae bacterium]|nr:hypothetical protein [Gemmataceae bacterium]
VLMEVFDPPEQTALIEQKLDVIAAHSTTALYNSAEMKRVPLKPLWWPLMQVQQGLGGKARFWTYFTLAAAAVLIILFTMVPYPLKLDATGKVAPLDRYYVYAPQEGRIVSFLVKPNDEIEPGAPVAVLFNPQFQDKILELRAQRTAAEGARQAASRTEGLTPAERQQKDQDKLKAQTELNRVNALLDAYRDAYNCDLDNPGNFVVTAPLTRPSSPTGRPKWTVLTQDIKDLLGRTVAQKDPILRVGHTGGGWEIVLKVPQKHMGKLLQGFKDAAEADERGEFLWVDVLPTSEPTPAYVGRGKLYQRDLKGAAEPNRDDQNEPEPVVFAAVRFNTPDIPAEYHLAPRLLVTDLEVKARVRSGDHSMGYSLFYGVWEFLYEKVIFFF